MTEPLYLKGCRHDILGHYLKAIGLLRVLAKCADPEHRDTEAEGWWDTGQACFCLRSEKYPTMEKLIEFFEKHYRPTPLASGWNPDPGLDEATAKLIGKEPEFESAKTLSSCVVTGKPEHSLPAGKLSIRQAFAVFRNTEAQGLTEEIDAISAPHIARKADNPLWLNKGTSGRAHALRTYWEHASRFLKLRKKKGFVPMVNSSLLNQDGHENPTKGKGTPFFPDVVKVYNTGSGWLEEKVPFVGLDYVLASEGAFATRGALSRILTANARPFASFPFVFDSGEDLINKDGETKETAASLWFPIWERPTCYSELCSFLLDGQARLQGKVAIFSAEFARAVGGQGVDAGFSGWQEFRFKQRITDVPSITTGNYVDGLADARRSDKQFGIVQTTLNRALSPIDEACFLDQFLWNGTDAGSRSPHRVGASINGAMQTAALEPSPRNCLALLESIFAACRQMCVSESFRRNLRGGRATFFKPLPMHEWDALLNDLAASNAVEGAEFRIARSLASITGAFMPGDAASTVEPMLGSLLPLKLGRAEWFLPSKGDGHNRDVWTGTDIAHDLAAVLQRRYMDSSKQDRPALMSPHGARLADVLAFLRNELDDAQIARWTEALSLINWRYGESGKAVADGDADMPDEPSEVIPPAYAALRTLLDTECEYQGSNSKQWKKRRSQQPFSLLCQRSVSSLPLAVSEALRWIGIWGVNNPWGATAREERERISGRYVISLPYTQLSFDHNAEQPLAHRLAASVCIPLRWQDAWQLARVITLPPGT